MVSTATHFRAVVRSRRRTVLIRVADDGFSQAQVPASLGPTAFGERRSFAGHAPAQSANRGRLRRSSVLRSMRIGPHQAINYPDRGSKRGSSLAPATGPAKTPSAAFTIPTRVRGKRTTAHCGHSCHPPPRRYYYWCVRRVPRAAQKPVAQSSQWLLALAL